MDVFAARMDFLSEISAGGIGLPEQAHPAARISENSRFVGRLKKEQEHVNAKKLGETRGQCAFPFIFVLRDFVWSD